MHPLCWIRGSAWASYLSICWPRPLAHVVVGPESLVLDVAHGLKNRFQCQPNPGQTWAGLTCPGPWTILSKIQLGQIDVINTYGILVYIIFNIILAKTNKCINKILIHMLFVSNAPHIVLGQSVETVYSTVNLCCGPQCWSVQQNMTFASP